VGSKEQIAPSSNATAVAVGAGAAVGTGAAVGVGGGLMVGTWVSGVGVGSRSTVAVGTEVNVASNGVLVGIGVELSTALAISSVIFSSTATSISDNGLVSDPQATSRNINPVEKRITVFLAISNICRV
jgi:hypothetical protein